MQIKTKFCRPHNIRLTYGSVFDSEGTLIDLKERGLDGECGVVKQVFNQFKKQGHNWLLLPQQEFQKEYVMCINCFEHSHL